jgi:hypothetical protein
LKRYGKKGVRKTEEREIERDKKIMIGEVEKGESEVILGGGAREGKRPLNDK